MRINQKTNVKKEKNAHLNHMAGTSYDISNPIVQLRTIAASCFFGEPMYYHDDISNSYSKPVSRLSKKDHDYLDSVLTPTISIPEWHSHSASKLMEIAIDEALDYDIEATLKEAVRLRQEEFIRTTPQVIMVRAANHNKSRGTGVVRKYAEQILSRTDEAALQLAYQIQVFGKPIPNALKKSWKKFLETRTDFQLAKYKMEKRAFKTVDVVNLVHAKSEPINLLMKGELKLKETDTWESLISLKGSTKENWKSAIQIMGHMALLRNIRNFIKNDINPDLYLPKLLSTAQNGKQLPFRYYSAYKQVEEIASGKILDTIEECLELSIGNLPVLEGKVMSLCDNSGSAQGTTSSSMGTMKVSSIANLMAVLTGKSSDDGYIGIFGDELKEIPIRKKESILSQLKTADEAGKHIGMGTENGIWLFFDKAIKNKEHYDHIFVYSDMQAGHGGLYGMNYQDYKDYCYPSKRNHIDVAKLIKDYRKNVNSNVNVFLVQVAGYKDTIIPEYYDKTYILGGWSDKILKFANEVIKKN